MNKNNKFLVGILALVVICVIGYALFSDNIKVTGTAAAQGQFMINTWCDVITSDTAYVGAGNVSGFKSSGTGTCRIENGVIKTSSTLLKPTDKVNFLVRIQNADANEFSMNLKKVTSPNNMTASGASGDIIYIDMKTGLSAWYRVFKVNSTLSNCGYTTTSIRGDSTVSAANLFIKSDCSMYMIITHSWEDASQLGLAQPAVPANGASINYNVELEFVQSTEQLK